MSTEAWKFLSIASKDLKIDGAACLAVISYKWQLLQMAKITFSLRNKVLNWFSECLVLGEVPMISGNTVIVS